MQRMSSVDDDHASVVSNDDSSRDRDEEVDSEDSSDPSEKPEEESSVQSPSVVDSAIAGSDSVITTGGNVAEVDSPMVVDDDDDEEEDEESSASEEDSAQQNNQVSDNINNSSAVSSGVMILPSGDSVSDATAADTILEEIARLSAELNRRVASVDALSSSSVVAQSTPAGVSEVVSSGHVSHGGGAMRSVGNALVNSDMVPRVRRWLPYQVPRNSSNSASASQQGSTSSSAANTPSSAQNQARRTSLPQQARISGNSQPRRSVANSNIPGGPRTTSSTSAVPTATTGQRQQGSNSNTVPQQVIRSAIVGNRTIITTKTPSKFPFSADLKQAGAAILGDRYILLDLCDGTSLYKCIDVKTKEEFVCKVSGGWRFGGWEEEREREITKYNLERNIIFIQKDIGKELKKGS